MQSTNSEYGLPYLAVCHITFHFADLAHFSEETFRVLKLIAAKDTSLTMYFKSENDEIKMMLCNYFMFLR